MPTKEQKHSEDVAGTKQRSPKPATESLDPLAQPQTLPAATVPRAQLDPRSLTPRDVLRLQRLVGNRSVARLLAKSSSQPRPAIQPKLTVGAAGDAYEQEADRTAEQVMSMPAPAQATPASNHGQAQRAEEDNVVQRLKDRKTGVPLGVDWDHLDAQAAKKLLQRIASQELSASPDEMSRLMDIANPDRHKGAQVDAQPSNFGTRMDAFDNPPTGQESVPPATYVVPSHFEMAEIEAKQKEVKQKTGIALTEDQAWSMVLGDKRGAHHQEDYRARALKRLEQLNAQWKTKYTEEDFDIIMEHLIRGTRIATNFTLSKTPGANTGSKVSTERLVDLLMQDSEFRNMWEIGASQASTDQSRRGAVEESMGYGHALRREQGAPLQQLAQQKRDDKGMPVVNEEGEPVYEPTGTFAPLNKAEMPKYAALVSQYQTHGVAPRYGTSVVYWKPTVRDRMTHTPGDSWNTTSAQGALGSFTSSKYPEVLFVRTNEELLRLAAAEATGKDHEYLERVKKKGGVTTDSYIETQIHGALRWEDVEEVVVGADEVGEMEIRQKLIQFRDMNGHSFRVTGKMGQEPKPAIGQPQPKTPLPSVYDKTIGDRAREIAAAAKLGDSGMFYEWSGPMGELFGYRDQDWIDFLGAITPQEQLDIATYINENFAYGLIDKMKKVLPPQLIPGGKAQIEKKTETKKPLTELGKQAKDVVAAAQLGDWGIFDPWVKEQISAYTSSDWAEFIDALDLSERRTIGVFFQVNFDENWLKRLRTVVPSAILPGGRTLSGGTTTIASPTPSVPQPSLTPQVLSGPQSSTSSVLGGVGGSSPQPQLPPLVPVPRQGRSVYEIVSAAAPEDMRVDMPLLLGPEVGPVSTSDPLKGSSSKPVVSGFTWLNQENYGDVRAKLARWLTQHGIQVLKNNGGGRNSCLIISLLQHATGELVVDQKTVAELKQFLSGFRIGEYDSLLPDDAAFRALITEINQRYHTNLKPVFIVANDDDPPFIMLESPIGARPVVVWDQLGHYEALI